MSTANRATETAREHAPHRVSVQEIDPSLCSGCIGYAAAYASALANLEAAGELADDAWQDYYDCSQSQGGGGNKPTINLAAIEADTQSILDR